jgi:2',3'-cyclic-nucleotide 2'-phosphodiesterase (5'-nucleotidase family)
MLVIVNIADLHSAYDHYPRLARVVSDLAETNGHAQLLVLVNGDVFEYGNVVGSRTEGAADWLFLERMAEHARVIVNIGNHEFDFHSPQEFMTRASEAGVTVIGNLGVTGLSSLPRPWIDIEHAGATIRIVGLATCSINTYPPACREVLDLPEPTAWLKTHFEDLGKGADHLIIASHAGVHADRAMLEFLAGDPRILYMVGGHNHLLIEENVNGIDYLQNGLKGERLTIARIHEGGSGMQADLDMVRLDSLHDGDQPLEQAIVRLKAANLRDEDLQTAGEVSRDKTLAEAAQWAVEALRRGGKVDVAVVNHTCFGSGLKAGPLKRHHFDEFIRFDNELFVAEVDAKTLGSILDGANQHRQRSIRHRSGDFLYASEIEIDAQRTYRLATTGWVADPNNQARYLGRTLDFKRLPGTTTKGLILAALDKKNPG